MHEQVRVVRGLDDERRRRRVAGEHDLPPRPRLAEHVVRRHGAAVRHRHLLPGLQLPARGAVGDAERVGGGDVEPAGPLRLASA